MNPLSEGRDAIDALKQLTDPLSALGLPASGAFQLLLEACDLPTASLEINSYIFQLILCAFEPRAYALQFRRRCANILRC